MLPLRDLQRQFGRAIRAEEGTVPLVRGNGLESERRVQIYRHNHRASLCAALCSVYPITQRLLGEAFFLSAADAYVRTHASASGNIQEYGEAFPEFLSGFRRDVMPAYVPDVAQLEWVRLCSALAAWHAPLDVAVLAAVPEPRQPELRFGIHPAVQRFSSRFPVLTIWQYCRAERQEHELELDGRGQDVLITRPEQDVTMRDMTRGEGELVQLLMKGAPFGKACEIARGIEPDLDLQAVFARLVQEWVIVEFTLSA